MKILFLASWFPSRVYPTHGNFIAKHARLAATEHDLTVLAIQYDPELAYGKQECIEREEDGYQLLQIYFGQPPGTSQYHKVFARWRAYRTGMERYRKKQGLPKLIHANILLDAGMVAAIYRQLWRVPFVITEQCTIYLEPGALRGIRYYLGRHACKRAAAILPVSRQLAEGMRDVNGLTGNYQPFSNVVDTDRFVYVPPQKAGPFRLLHVSNFVEAHKNVQGIINAFAVIYQESSGQIQLVLAGDGDHAALRKRIVAADLPQDAILLSGPHTEAEIADLMRDTHAFILFSNYETQGVVLLEAMASGRPVIATKVPGILDVVQADYLGHMIPAADEIALKNAMLDTWENYDRFDAAAIRQYALDRYSEPAILALLNQYYQNAVER